MFQFFGVGHLTAAPESRVTPNGATIVSARVAVNRTFTNRSNETVEETDYWQLKILGKRGEAFAKHLGVGSKVVISGELQQDHWEDKETKAKRTATILLVNEWEFADSKKLGQASKPAPEMAGAGAD